MGFFLTKTLVWWLLAGVLAWLLTWWFCCRRLQREVDERQAALDTLRREHDAATARLQALSQEQEEHLAAIGGLKSEAAARSEELAQRAEQHRALALVADEVPGLKETLAAQLDLVASLKDELAASQAQAAQSAAQAAARAAALDQHAQALTAQMAVAEREAGQQAAEQARRLAELDEALQSTRAEAQRADGLAAELGLARNEAAKVAGLVAALAVAQKGADLLPALQGRLQAAEVDAQSAAAAHSDVQRILEGRLADAEARHAAAAAAAQTLQAGTDAQLKSAQAALSAAEQAAQQAQARNVAALAGAQDEAQAQAAQLSLLSQQVNDWQAQADRVPRLTQEVEQLSAQAARVPTLEAELGTLRESAARVPVLEGELSGTQRRLADLHAERDALAQALAGAQSEAGQVEALRARLTAAEQSLAAAPTVAPLDVGAARAILGAAVREDDLVVLEGIGPKVAELLHKKGIRRWSELADTPESQLRAILDAGGPSFRNNDPRSWPHQAALLASGQWRAFKALADVLDEGRYPDPSRVKAQALAAQADEHARALDAARHRLAEVEAEAARLPALSAELAAARADAAQLDGLRARVAALEPLAEEAAQARPLREEVARLERALSERVPRAVLDLAAGQQLIGVPVREDDLALVEGIGPKVAELLHQAGIHRWAELAVCDEARLRAILDAGGPHYRINDPRSWPHQAALLAHGRWQEFKHLTDQLEAGRYVDPDASADHRLGRAQASVAPARPPAPDLAAGAAALGRALTMDDLTVVEGIGERISELCHAAGIHSWWDLSQTPTARLVEMLEAAGPRYRMHAPDTWPQQAGLLASGQWAAFKTLTDHLKGGRPAT